MCCGGRRVQDTPDTVLWNPPNGSALHWRTLMESVTRYAGGQDAGTSSPTSTAPCSLRTSGGRQARRESERTGSTSTPTALGPLANVATSRSQRREVSCRCTSRTRVWRLWDAAGSETSPRIINVALRPESASSDFRQGMRKRALLSDGLTSSVSPG